MVRCLGSPGAKRVSDNITWNTWFSLWRNANFCTLAFVAKTCTREDQNFFVHDALRYILPHCGWSEHIREVRGERVEREETWQNWETGTSRNPWLFFEDIGIQNRCFHKTYVHIYIDSRYCHFKPLTVTWSLPLFLIHFMALQPRLEPIFK